MFSMSPPREYISSTEHTKKMISRVKAGSNNSTVALRVVGGDKQESLKSETVKYGRESQGTRTQK
jgi:hypothetical protein